MKRVLFFSLAAVLLLTTGLFSQSVQFDAMRAAFRSSETTALAIPISCGQTVCDSIALVGQQNTYTFSANAGEAVIISAVVNSGTLAARAELYGPPPANKLIGSNVFGNTNTGSLKLSESGIYTIIVRDYNLNRTGAYCVNLQSTTGRCGISIACGQTLRGNFTSKARQDSYTFNANSGEAVVISAVANSGTLAARAELYDPFGTFIGSNVFGNTNTGTLKLTASGTYTILTRDYDFGHTGSYDVNLQFTSGRCGIPIACGQTLSGIIASRAQQDSYSFFANAGEAVIVAAVATAGTLAARAELYDPFGTFISSNVFGNTNTGSLKLTVNGIYTILIRDYNFSNTATYDVNLQFTTGRCGISISSGQTKSGNLRSKAQQETYSFCGRQNGSVNISAVAVSNPLAARAELYDPSGTFVGSNVFGNTSTGNLQLRTTGTYTIVVRDYDFTHTGNYNVNLSCTAMSCDDPLANITSLSPSSAQVGGAGFVLTVNGNNFAASSVMRWNGTNRATTFVSTNQLRATIPSSDIASEGVASVTILNTVSGGGCSSNALAFTINKGTPSNPDIDVQPTTLDFGNVVIGATADRTLAVHNLGNAALTVASMTIVNSIFKIITPATPFNVSPSGQQIVTVRFSPTTVGAQAGTLTINSNDPDEAVVNVPLSGVGINQPTLSASPTTLSPGDTLIAAWSGIVSPTTKDWIGLYVPGAADTDYKDFRYTMSAANGRMPYPLSPTLAPGSYELRLFTNDTYTRLAVSNAFTAVPRSTNRIVRVVNANSFPGGSVNVPIELVAQGDENALGFTLTFDPAVLSNPQPARGKDAGVAALNINDTQKSQGRLGIALALPSGQMFAAGIREIIVVSFAATQNTSATSTMIDFGDQVIRREIINANANPLTATWTSGKVTLSCGVEADVAPRSTSDGRVSIADWVQVGRFAAALDIAVNGCEFQKADCAAKPCGDGRIGIADWVQAGRYAAGLDPLVPACGSTSSTSANMPTTVSQAAGDAVTARAVRVINKTFFRGQTDSLTVELDAQGDENALGFSLNFDPALMTFLQAKLGSGATAAALNVNNSQATNGRLGIALGLPSGQKFAAGARPIVTVFFLVNRNALPTSTAVEFGDQPIAREIVDADANALTSIWTSGTIMIQIPTSVNEKANGAPTSFALEQNYPNPFNPATTIAFSLPRAEQVTLKIFNLVGREIVTLIDEKLAAGRYETHWDASGVESGTFFYQLRAGEFGATKKLVLMK